MAVVKKHDIAISTGYGSKSKIQLQADNCKGQPIVKPTTSRDTLKRIETQIANADKTAKKQNSAEKNRYLENKVARDKYHKTIPCPQSQLEITYGTIIMY